MNKQYIVPLRLVVAVLAIGVYAFGTSQQRDAGWPVAASAQFTDSAIGVAIEYNPTTWTMIAGDNTEYPVGSSLFDPLSSNSASFPIRTSFLLNEDAYQGTNLFGAWVSLSSFTRGVVSDTAMACQSARQGDGFMSLKETKDINGTTWYYGTATEAAAGTAFTTHIYHTMHDEHCIELTQTIAEGNIGNWEPGMIKEFNREQVQGALDAIVDSVKFID